MVTEWDGEHPSEGTIHAWIDQALDVPDADRVATHVMTCAACQASVAAARRLAADASRVIALLDDPSGPMAYSVPQQSAQSIAKPVAATNGSVWRMLRVTPARASIAAVLIIAVGITLTRQYVAVESTSKAPDATTAVVTQAKASAAPSGKAQPSAELPVAAMKERSGVPRVATAPPVRDSLLRTAIGRRLAADQPERTMEPAQGGAIPSAPASVGNFARMDSSSARQVLAARAARQMVTDAAMAAPDRVGAKAVSPVPADAGCYRIDPVELPASTWGGVPLPVDVVLADAAGTPDTVGAPRYAILPVGGGAQIGAWSRAAGDTLSISLHGITSTTSGVLVSSGGSITGVLRAPARATAGALRLRTAETSVRVAAHRITCGR